MTRNPRLKPLKDRLNPAQRMKRRVKMKETGTWRKDMQREHAITRGGVNSTARGIEMVFRKHRLTRYLVYGLGLSQLVTLAKVLGYL